MSFLSRIVFLLFGLPILGAAAIAYFFGLKILLLTGAVYLIFVGLLFRYGSKSELNEDTLAADLASLKIAFGDVYDKELRKEYDATSVSDDYTLTTDRDYKALEFFYGPGLSALSIGSTLSYRYH